MKKIFTILLSLFLLQTAYAQVPVGYYFDISGQPIEQFAGPLSYTPTKSLSFSYNGINEYEVGAYYTHNGEKKDGFVNFNKRKILFKESFTGKPMKLDPENCQAFLVGQDSFFVASIFEEGDTDRKSVFLQYIATIDELIVGKHYYYPPMNQVGYISTYHILRPRFAWQQFSDINATSFKITALQYFGNFPLLREQIENEDINDDIMRMVKTAQYLHNNGSQKILFDQYWNEIEKQDLATYYADISYLAADSIWDFTYYKGDRKLYEIQYSKLFPHVRHGVSRIYYSNGQLKRESIYDKNDMLSSKVFYENGQLHHHYTLEEWKKDGRIWEILNYIEVKNLEGIEVLNEHSSGVETFTDKLSNREITNIYNLSRLQESYSTVNGDKYYQIRDRFFQPKLTKAQNNITEFFGLYKFKNAVAENANGTVFLALKINEKGLVEDVQILNQIHPNIDTAVQKYVNKYLNPETRVETIKFSKYEVNDEKVKYEFILPIQFGISKFYSKTRAYHDFGFLNDMMWQNQQMMMQNHINNIQVPSFPR